MSTQLRPKIQLFSMQHVKNVCCAVLLGLQDSLSGIAAVRYLRTRDTVATEEQRGLQRRRGSNNAIKRIIECCILNGGVFWFSILAFEYFLLPCLYWFMKIIFGSSPALLTSVWYWLQPLLSYTFGALWVLPLFFLSRIVNALWFQDIADSAFRGRSQSLRSISKLIADTLFSLVIQALFIIQSLLVALLPISFVGHCFSLFHLSLLYSLYSFEYKWFNMGWELHQRLRFIEENWAYFFGFGLPLAILTSLPESYIISGCIFSIVFPLFIISGNEAKPRRGMSLVQLPLFQPVVWFSNKICSLLILLYGFVE